MYEKYFAVVENDIVMMVAYTATWFIANERLKG